MAGMATAQLAGEVAHQSWMQGLFEDIWPMEGGHIQGWGGGVSGGGNRIALSLEGVVPHVRWGWALLIVLLSTLVVKRERKPFPFLPAVAEPHAHNLFKDTTQAYEITIGSSMGSNEKLHKQLNQEIRNLLN